MSQLKVTVGDQIPALSGRTYRVLKTLRGGSALVEVLDKRHEVIETRKVAYFELLRELKRLNEPAAMKQQAPMPTEQANALRVQYDARLRELKLNMNRIIDEATKKLSRAIDDAQLDGLALLHRNPSDANNR